MPSTWLQKARRLPCLALTRSLCVWLCCQPASRSHFAFVRARALAICPELFACCARSDCTAPCRGAGTPLLAAEAHTSATTADLSTPPPHPSPSLCSRQESSRHTGTSQRGSRVSGGEGGKPLSPSQRFSGGVTKRPKDIRACAAGGISRLEISSIQGGRAGVDVSYCLRNTLYSKPGGFARFGAQVRALRVASLWLSFLYSFWV